MSFVKLSAPPFIYIKNEKSGYTNIDRSLFKIINFPIIKEVNYKTEKNVFDYPACLKITGKGYRTSKIREKEASLILDFKLTDGSRSNKSGFRICVAGKESEDINYLEKLNITQLYNKYNLVVATNKASFFKLNQVLKNKIKVIQCSEIENQLSNGHRRFVKICNIAINENGNILNIFDRLSVSEIDKQSYAIYQNLYSIWGLLKRRLIARKINVMYGNIIKPRLLSFWKSICHKFIPLNKKCIVFRTFQQEYCCNPKYICQELIKRNTNLRLVWIVNKKKVNIKTFPECVTLIQQNSFKAWYYLTCAKFLIDNNVRKAIPIKKPKQIQIQTWHGSLGIKKFTNVWSKETTQRANDDTDILLSNSDFESNVYRESVWKTTPILKIGHPRNDIFFNDSERAKIKQKIFEEYGISKEKKIILYAPTFRDQHLYGSKKQKSDLSMYLDNDALRRIQDTCQQTFNGEFVVLIRYHSHLLKLLDHINANEIIDVSNYPDIQELLLVTDVGITDYSSWIYDYLLVGRPGFIYASDRNEYLKERELYFPIDDTPFPFSSSIEELILAIKTFDKNSFEKRRQIFLQRANCVESGSASASIVNYMLGN